MHAYLVVGTDEKEVLAKVDELSDKLGKMRLDFSLTKIEEVRNLARFTKLSQDKPTTIVIKGVETSTPEALNAFLKSLEEPQTNIKFILTTSSEHKLLPTIVSRCQVVRVTEKNKSSISLAKKFLKLSTPQKFILLDKIKKKEEATKFLEELIKSLHALLIIGKNDIKSIAKNLKRTQKTLNNIYANGNVGLQLTNFIVNTPTLD